MAIKGVAVREGVNSETTGKGGNQEKSYKEPLTNVLNIKELIDKPENFVKLLDEPEIFEKRDINLSILYLLNSLKKVENTGKEIDKINNERNNNDIFEKISDILFSLHDNGFKHILNKDIFLNIYEKYVVYKPKSVSFPTLILNYLDIFSGLDQEVVDIILEKGNNDRTNKKRAKIANMILLNIKSFDKINIIEVLSIFSENIYFIEDKIVNRMFYSGYIKGESEFKEKIIKDLIDAGYLEDLRNSYNSKDGSPLEEIGITEKKLEKIAKKVQGATSK